MCWFGGYFPKLRIVIRKKKKYIYIPYTFYFIGIGIWDPLGIEGFKAFGFGSGCRFQVQDHLFSSRPQFRIPGSGALLGFQALGFGVQILMLKLGARTEMYEGSGFRLGSGILFCYC